MFPKVISNGLTLPKVLGGIQKTLNIANQLIPIYTQVKPMIKNAQSAFAVAKGVLTTTSASSSNSKNSLKNIEEKKEQALPIQNLNNPVFFL